MRLKDWTRPPDGRKAVSPTILRAFGYTHLRRTHGCVYTQTHKYDFIFSTAFSKRGEASIGDEMEATAG